MITVTKPFLPPREEYNKLLEGIWQRNWLTNHGPLVKELEAELKTYLDVPYCYFVTNGTIALQIAIKALELSGEIITTPFSYVATTSSIVWEGCKPVFVDIDARTFNIDPQKIEAAITADTSAILATHIFGSPCDVEAIQDIADRHNLKVIYDAAHAFGVRYKGKSIFEYGDISVTSFHATKLFHTVEGGGMFTTQEALYEKIRLLRNFGHTSAVTFDGIGTNAKNSEFHAAVGICNLKYITGILSRRKAQFRYYREQLGKQLQFPELHYSEDTDYNYSYVSVLFPSENILLEVKKHLEANNIFSRRYFYPSLSSLNYVASYDTPIADNIASRILCLPLYHELENTEIKRICESITEILQQQVLSQSLLIREGMGLSKNPKT